LKLTTINVKKNPGLIVSNSINQLINPI